MMWFQREEPGAAVLVGSCGKAGGFRCAEQGGAGDGGGAEREKESSANQAFRRNGLIPERKAGTRGYDWESGRFWSFDVETFRKYGSSSKLRMQSAASERQLEPDVLAACKEEPQLQHKSKESGRQQLFFQEHSSSAAGLTGNPLPNSVHQPANSSFFGSLAAMIALGTQNMESGLMHSLQDRVSHSSLQAGHSYPFFGGIFSPAMTNPVHMAESLLQQQQIQHLCRSESERRVPLLAAPGRFWAEMLSGSTAEPLTASMPSLGTAPGFSSATEVQPFSISPFVSAGQGLATDSPNFRSENRQSIQGKDGDRTDIHALSILQPQFCSNSRPLLAPELVSASIWQSQSSQQLSLNQWQGTGNSFGVSSGLSSTFRASTQQLATSQEGSDVLMGMGASEISHPLRPFRPTPLRPIMMSGSIAHGSNSRFGMDASDQPYRWNADRLEAVPFQLFNAQGYLAAPNASNQDEDDSSQIATGSRLNP